MSTTAVGRQAEVLAAEYLCSLGCQVVQNNWRTRWCEIDIVATKNQVVYFTEVKYRRSQCWGSGLDYITNKKLAQMRFAAELWLAKNGKFSDYRLAAIEVSGRPQKITGFVESIDF